MNIQDIRYFVEVGKRKSFSRAAEALYVNEATISYQIRKLEDELEIKLFERTKRSVEFTPAGAAVFARASQLVKDYDALSAELNQMSRSLKNQCSVGMVPVMNTVGLIEILHGYAVHNSGKEIKVQIASEDRLCEQLQKGEIDFAIVKLLDGAEDVFDPDIYSYAKLKDECVYVLMGRKIAPKGVTSLTMDESVRYPVICDRDGSYYRRVMERTCGAQGIKIIAYPVETNDLSTIISIIEANKAIDYASASAAAYYSKMYDLKSIKIVPEFHQYISVVYMKQHKLSPEDVRMIEYLKDALSDR